MISYLFLCVNLVPYNRSVEEDGWAKCLSDYLFKLLLILPSLLLSLRPCQEEASFCQPIPLALACEQGAQQKAQIIHINAPDHA